MDNNTSFVLTMLIVVGIPCLTMFGISWARHRNPPPTSTALKDDSSTAFHNLPANVDYIVRSPEQPTQLTTEWDDATHDRVFGNPDPSNS